VTGRNGKTTDEGAVYKDLAGVVGIAPGKEVTRDGKKMIETPYYPVILSVDDVPKEKRSQAIGMISKNVVRIQNAIASLTNAGYSYSDPLQFGFNDGKLDLLDFSNANKPDKDDRRNVLEDNYGHLITFYRQFGLEKQADIIFTAMNLKRNLETFQGQSDEDVEPWLPSSDFELRKQAKRTNKSPNNIYYVSDGREVQLKDIGQTDKVNGLDVKFVISEKPLSDKDIETWELKPIYTQSIKK
jgi:hypothetical protein